MTEHRPKVLAIDDHPENLVVLGQALSDDFDFQFATSGLAGIKLAESSPPDLILLDVMMPDVDGFETCRRLKSHQTLSGVPVVFITALSDIETESSGLLLGAADYITKPFKAELVKLRVKNIIMLTRVSQQLKESEERLRLVMNATGDGIWDWDMASDIVTHNASWCGMLGLNPSSISHAVADFFPLIHPEDKDVVRERLDLAIKSNSIYTSEHRLLHADGHYFWVADRGQVVSSSADGLPLRMVGAVKNIDARKKNEAEIERLAFYDPLTELPNRRLLLDRLQQILIVHKRTGAQGVLMFLDLDRFKLLNDTYGHAQGDLLLIQVGDRLRNCVREHDTVARLGGDEFIVMLNNVYGNNEEALKIALSLGNKIIESLNQPYQLSDSLTYVSTPSIGLTLFSDTSDSIDDIFHRADEAMYQAKSAGRNNIKVLLKTDQIS